MPKERQISYLQKAPEYNIVDTTSNKKPMNGRNVLALGALALVVSAAASFGDVNVVTNRNRNGSPEFRFRNVPAPSKTDAAARIKFTIVSGEQDPAGGGVEKLTDGELPDEDDQPAENFFFNLGKKGGRLQLDLGSVINVNQVNSYSWHPGTRGPQVYTLYASEGTSANFNAAPKEDTDPAQTGWKQIARVDTRPANGQGGGGQYGVSISDSSGSLGKYRYLLFDCSPTETDDDFGNTFYSEIDVVSPDKSASPTTGTEITNEPFVTHSADGKCEITIDTRRARDLKDWARTKLAPALAEWYPKIVTLLPSEGYTAPNQVQIIIRPGGQSEVAGTTGTNITANANWMRNQINGQAIGSIVHEFVHVVQRYRNVQAPGWLTEGIADYIRWYLYEPQSHGTDIKTERAIGRARYNASYRVTANFLDYVSQKYDKNIVTKINADIRQGKYSDELWKTYTGKSVTELAADWKKGLYEKAGMPVPASGGAPTPAPSSGGQP